MRVLALIPDAFGGYGGMSLYNRDLLTALCSFPECREVVAIPRVMPHEPEPLPDGLTHVTEGLEGTLSYLRAVLAAAFTRQRFDLIVCGHINLLPIAFALRTWLRVPIVLEIYGIDAWQPHRSPFVNALVRRVDAFISISRVTTSRFLEWSGFDESRGSILPNAIHAELYGVAPKNRELVSRYRLQGRKVLMTFGRLVSFDRQKGFDAVLEVLPQLLDRDSSLVYVIAGDGPDSERLAQKARRLGVEEQVVFTGMVPEPEKADYFRLADAYVMPSQGEGFGFVILEAMACGVPVLASKADGSREAIRDGELGVLIDPEDPLELTNGILEALERPREVPEGLAHFSFENFTLRLHNICQSILNTRA